MSDEPATICRADEAEAKRAYATITAAFIADPVTRFAWPDAQTYLTAFPGILEALCAPSFGSDLALVADEFTGAALWVPPSDEVHDAGGEDPGAAIRDFLSQTSPADRVDDMVATFLAMGSHHPQEPHWYLPFIGVDPAAQGRGIGAALMKQAVARFDADGTVAYLESSNPRNISLYERFGFERTGEIQMGRAPVVTPMVRAPQG
ncbi:MAG: N-acetyltransferase [Pseudomonadales bacterium]|jgi:ribosomal protein S18 acetylase RimI-like enzyme|nr:N-acetyltransferase [Pseudomonadales bacterium]